MYVGVRVFVCVVGPNDVGCSGFDGDDTEVEREFAGTQSLAESVALVASASSGVFPTSLSCTLLSHLTTATPIRCGEAFFPSIKITHVNTLETLIVHADSIY